MWPHLVAHSHLPLIRNPPPPGHQPVNKLSVKVVIKDVYQKPFKTGNSLHGKAFFAVVEPRSMDTHLIWTPIYKWQFIFPNINLLNTDIS